MGGPHTQLLDQVVAVASQRKHQLGSHGYRSGKGEVQLDVLGQWGLDTLNHEMGHVSWTYFVFLLEQNEFHPEMWLLGFEQGFWVVVGYCLTYCQQQL